MRAGRLFNVLVMAGLAVGVIAPRQTLASAADFSEERNHMVDVEIVRAGIKDPRVVRSMRETPRHEFVPRPMRNMAYLDMALAISQGQTISPPFVVAYMTEQLEPQPTDKVLEIGTGSGYQAAVLSPLVKDVYTIEIVPKLGERAAATLKRLKYTNVHTKVGDGYQGWPEFAPFDKIIVTCSPENVPPKLVEQLREGGRMLVPVGERYQQTIYLFQKKDGKLTKVPLLPVLFVPMTGAAEAGRQVKPDPANPSIHNGGFEELSKTSDSSGEHKPPSTVETETDRLPYPWYYYRQMKVVEAKDAPEGSHYITFSNNDPGRNSQALQGIAIDGRKVNELTISLFVKAENVRPGSIDTQVPVLAITFYDENRNEAGHRWIGPWRDSFAWQKVVEKMEVPPKTREAIMRIGLFGATGEISFDDIQIRGEKSRP